jgi:DNA (cytosine-5)-methyltransferase 3A
MNVLSLFDGMSCGQIALNKLGIKYDNYFASEVEKWPIKVTQNNFPNTIQLGDVKNIYFEDGFLYTNDKEIPVGKIDLLIGGSPCTDLSVAGKRKGLISNNLKTYLKLKKENVEFKGQSYLFWEYVRLLNKIKPKYFLLENVKMEDKWKDLISKELKTEPIFINSRLVSAQDRKRYYWTNMPNVDQPKDRNISFSDIVEDGGVCAGMRGRRIDPKTGKRTTDKNIPFEQQIECRKDNKSNCLTTVSKDNIVVPKRIPRTPLKNSTYRYLTPTEYEKLQTIPINYTKIAPKTARIKMIGNGWTVDVIAHILKNIKK